MSSRAVSFAINNTVIERSEPMMGEAASASGSPVPSPVVSRFTPAPDWAYQRVWKWFTNAAESASETKGGAVCAVFGGIAIAFLCLLLLIGGKISEACSENENPPEEITYSDTPEGREALTAPRSPSVRNHDRDSDNDSLEDGWVDISSVGSNSATAAVVDPVNENNSDDDTSSGGVSGADPYFHIQDRFAARDMTVAQNALGLTREQLRERIASLQAGRSTYS